MDLRLLSAPLRNLSASKVDPRGMKLHGDVRCEDLLWRLKLILLSSTKCRA